jgi:hypothetical protein
MNKEKRITTYREEYYPDTTIGNTFVDGIYFSYSLEDTVRPEGIKVQGHTAIPAGVLNVMISYSNRFQRETLQLYNGVSDDGQYIVTDGICVWYGIRNHGGNTEKDTEGCPLTAYNRVNEITIQGRSDKDLLNIVKKWINEGYDVKWEFINGHQEN